MTETKRQPRRRGIEVRLNEAEVALIAAAAERSGIGVATYMRQAAVEKARREDG